MLARIATHPSPIELSTDWSFVMSYPPRQPRDWEEYLTLINTVHGLAVQSTLPHLSLGLELCEFSSLRQLDIKSTIGNKDVQRVSQLSCLESLTFSPNSTTSIVPLSTLPNLTYLNMHGDYLADCSSVGMCEQLRALHIQGGDRDFSPQEAQSISQLQHLSDLKLYILFPEHDDEVFAHIFTMRSLRVLLVCMFGSEDKAPASSFSSLPAPCSLESLCIAPVGDEDLPALVDCLVQMPRLRHIGIESRRLSSQEEAILRGALPRLETLAFYRLS